VSMSAFGAGVDRAHTPRARTGRDRIGSGAWHSAGSCRAPAVSAAPRQHVSARVLRAHQCLVRPRFPTAPASRSRTQDTRPAPDTHHRSSDTRRHRPATARSNQAAGDADTPRESATHDEDALDARFSSTGQPGSPIPPSGHRRLDEAPNTLIVLTGLSGERGRAYRDRQRLRSRSVLSLSSLRLAGHAGCVSRRSATRTTAVMPTSLVVWPAGSRPRGWLWGIYATQGKRRICTVASNVWTSRNVTGQEETTVGGF
jgi:hypothetical protein